MRLLRSTKDGGTMPKLVFDFKTVQDRNNFAGMWYDGGVEDTMYDALSDTDEGIPEYTIKEED